MAAHFQPTPHPDRRAGRSGGGSPDGTDIVSDLRSRLRRIAVLPAVAVAALGGIVAILFKVDRSVEMRYVALVVGLAGFVGVLIDAVTRANGAASAIHQQIDRATHGVGQRIKDLRSATVHGHEELQRLVAQIRTGQRPIPHGAPTAPAPGSEPIMWLAYNLTQLEHAAQSAVLEVADLAFGGDSDQRVAVLVNFARRLQSLIHRAIRQLDELERQVEDPELLKGLFRVDHLATRVRRQAESLSVLSGGISRRKWSDPVAMYSVLRSAVAEIEQYVRVKVVRPIEGSLHGHAVADIIHLIAELVENATEFSAPETQVRLSAQYVTVGLALEVEDRGLGMRLEDQQRMNALLTDPGQTEVRDELLQSARIGLCVVSTLARRHGVAVRLQTNIYGGTDAIVVIPRHLLGDEPQHNGSHQLRQRTQISAVADNVPPAPPASASSPHTAFTPTPPGQALRTISHSQVRQASAASSNWHEAPGFGAQQPQSAPGGWGPPPPGSERPSNPPSSVPSATARAPASHPPAVDGRPPLPQRTRGAHVHEFGQPAPNQPTGDLNPALMAAFQRGMNDDAGSTGHPSKDN